VKRNNPVSGPEKRRVLAAGTFEYLHPGHLAFLKNASRYGALFVVVSRDDNARKAKGRRTIVPQDLRLKQIQALPIVKKALLGGRDGLLGGIRKVAPDTIYLGPDQMPAEKLRSILRKNGLGKIRVVKMRKRVGNWKSSEIIRHLLD
jgi:FAD synthetase